MAAAANGSCTPHGRIGARRPRPMKCTQQHHTDVVGPGGSSSGGGSSSDDSSTRSSMRRSWSKRPHPTQRALLVAVLPAAMILLLLLAAAVPGGRAFVPLRDGQRHQQQSQQQRQRHRPRASLTSDMLQSSMPPPSQPPGGSSPPSSGSTVTSFSASAASLAPPRASQRRASRLEQASSVEMAHSALRRSQQQHLPQQQQDHHHHDGSDEQQQHAQQEQAHQHQHQRPSDEILAGPLVQALVEELPSLHLEAALTRTPRLFQLRDASALRRRLQALKAALPGGVNVTHVVLEAPRLATYYGRDAAAMEAAVGPRFRALCEATGTAADAAEIVNRFPRVLLRDFARRVQPHLAGLAELLPGSDAAYLLRKHPAVLGRSVEAHLRPRIQQHLPALFPADAGLVEAAAEGKKEEEKEKASSSSSQQHHPSVGLGALAVNYPELLTAPLGTLQARVDALTQLLPPGLLLPTLSRHARAWTADLGEEVGPQVRLLRERLGEETARTVLLNMPSAMYHTPAALAKRLGLLEALLGPDAHAVLALNPMILAVDAAAHVAPKVRYLRALFDPAVVDEARFYGMLATEAGAKCLTAAFGRLGRLSYLLSVQPGLDLGAGLKLCVTSSEELRRRYPGYENFLEDRIEPRFPNYTWEQLCALPFAMREQAHGEILHTLYSLPVEEGEEGEEGEALGGFFEPIDPLALLDDEGEEEQEQEQSGAEAAVGA